MTYGDLRARYRISWSGLMSALRNLENWHLVRPGGDGDDVPEVVVDRLVPELEQWEADGHLDRFR